MGVCLTLCWVRLGQDCRGRRPGILDAVHVLRPARSEVVVKLGARRAASLTQLRGRDTHAVCDPCVMRCMGDVVDGCVPTLCRVSFVGTQWAGG
jgi:hypothetical protein